MATQATQELIDRLRVDFGYDEQQATGRDALADFIDDLRLEQVYTKLVDGIVEWKRLGTDRVATEVVDAGTPFRVWNLHRADGLVHLRGEDGTHLMVEFADLAYQWQRVVVQTTPWEL